MQHSAFISARAGSLDFLSRQSWKTTPEQCQLLIKNQYACIWNSGIAAWTVREDRRKSELWRERVGCCSSRAPTPLGNHFNCLPRHIIKSTISTLLLQDILCITRRWRKKNERQRRQKKKSFFSVFILNQGDRMILHILHISTVLKGSFGIGFHSIRVNDMPCMSWAVYSLKDQGVPCWASCWLWSSTRWWPRFAWNNSAILPNRGCMWRAPTVNIRRPVREDKSLPSLNATRSIIRSVWQMA